MSFSSNVKNELVKIEYDNICCKKSLLYGMALFAKSFSARNITFQTENESSAQLFKSLLLELRNIDCKIEISPAGKTYTISLDRSDSSKLFSYFSHSPQETSLKLNASNFTCPHCQNAFLAGAFLSCGTILTPEKGYHLEFVVPFLNLSKSFVTLLREMELSPKTANRKGYNIIYFKGSEVIEDCLYIMGAASSMFDMMNVKIVKEIRNTANRKANCDAANIEKTVAAASPQIAAIMKIEREKGLDSLSEPLRQMAEIRMENPDSSLKELAEMFDPPISRSGVNHRLSRLVKIAEDL